MSSMKPGLDVIGDIHGRIDLLEKLLEELGCRHAGGTDWTLPKGRRILFLGDLIDRNPGVLRVLKTVRGLVENEGCVCVMGNHEFNAVCWDIPLPEGGWLRRHSEKNEKQHRQTLAELQEGSDLRREWTEWFRRLPAWFQAEGITGVHACRHEEEFRLLRGKGLVDEAGVPAAGPDRDAFFRFVADEANGAFRFLKAPEIALPAGASFKDKDGHPRREARYKWWLEEMPGGWKELLRVDDAELDRIEGLDGAPMPDASILCRPEGVTFVGHYWLPAAWTPAIQTPRLACLDYSAGKGGPLTAYRWNTGEDRLFDDRFVCVR